MIFMTIYRGSSVNYPSMDNHVRSSMFTVYMSIIVSVYVLPMKIFFVSLFQLATNKGLKN